MLDLSLQNRIQEELQQSEARFRAMFVNSAVGIGVMGLDRKVLDANPAMCQMLGRSPEEIIGQTPAFVTYPDDLPSSTEQHQDLLSGKIDHYVSERRYLRKNGEVFWASVSMSLVRDAIGKPLYLVGLITDIDAQKRAVEDLRESEARFRAMFDNAAVGIALMTLNRRVVSINKIAERIIGYKMEDLIDVDPTDLSHPDDRTIGATEFREMVEGRRNSFFMEKRYIRKDGSTIWARVTYSMVPGKDGKPQYLIGMIEDISEQRESRQKIEEQEHEYRAQLEQRVQERTRELSATNLRLVGEIEQRQRAEEALATKAVEEAIVNERTRLARDLHDAVTQTLFSASLVADVLPDLWQMDVEEARRSTEELRQLTRGALAEMRTLLLELRPAALTQTRFPDLLKQLTEALVGRARLPINLMVEGDERLPPEVQVALYRIAQESLNNVVKYARATQVEIKLRLSCCEVHLEIIDNGIGFKADTIKPTSLGMRIMRERAEAIGARFQVTSTPGTGTRVLVDWLEDELVQISDMPIEGVL